MGILLWKVEEGHDANDENLKETYAWCREFITEYTSHPVEFYVDHDHPDMVAMIGSWNSIEEHFAELHKSEDFMEIMHAFGGVINVKSSFHVNISKDELERVRQGNVLLVNRTWVPDNDLPEFKKRYQESWLPKAIQANTKQVTFGWRITDGGWSEMDAIDYFDEDEKPDPNAIAKSGTEEEEALQEMNELVTIVGCDNIEDAEELRRKSRQVSDTSYREVAKRMYTRRFVKMDLPDPEGDDGDDDE